MLDTCKVAVYLALAMNTTQLRELLSTRQVVDFEKSDQDYNHSLRLMLRNEQSGELGILEITPDALVLPDELMLNYSYEEVRA